MSVQRVERRVLGAVRFTDAVTGVEVAAPLKVAAPGVRWLHNRRGWWVMTDAPGLDAHTAAFAQPPAQPAPGSVPVRLTVEDPSGRYLARSATLALPRDPDPAHAADDASLFRPVEVRLFPAPAAAGLSAGWAVVRATVTGAGGARLGGALLRVTRKTGGEVLGRGVSDARGEALLAVAGIPVTTWTEGSGGVLSTAVETKVQVLWDAAAGPLSDPDDLERRRETTPALLVKTVPVTLTSGKELALTL